LRPVVDLATVALKQVVHLDTIASKQAVQVQVAHKDTVGLRPGYYFFLFLIDLE
jgi:hypothetical protein